METSVWPRVRAQRAFCEAEILARAAALILRGPCNRGALFNPVSALIAVSNAFTCCAALSRSAFNCAIMSMFASGEDCSKYSRNYAALCINVNSAQKHRQAPSFLRSAAIDLPAIASYHSLTDGHALTTRRADHFALPHRRAVGWRRHGCGVRSRRTSDWVSTLP